MTTLRATRADHRPPAAGAHANKKTMGALATHNGRLVGTFHGNPHKFKKPPIRASREDFVNPDTVSISQKTLDKPTRKS
jgi:hypothetical protein